MTFTSSEEASAAISGMDGNDVHGRMVRVSESADLLSASSAQIGARSIRVPILSSSGFLRSPTSLLIDCPRPWIDLDPLDPRHRSIAGAFPFGSLLRESRSLIKKGGCLDEFGSSVLDSSRKMVSSRLCCSGGGQQLDPGREEALFLLIECCGLVCMVSADLLSASSAQIGARSIRVPILSSSGFLRSPTSLLIDCPRPWIDLDPLDPRHRSIAGAFPFGSLLRESRSLIKKGGCLDEFGSSVLDSSRKMVSSRLCCSGGGQQLDPGREEALFLLIECCGLVCMVVS
ncbi:hypothetical protein ZIOFF_061532 [Zingiber officinale]|uniref:Uncharacterized protein n=1 Tax=Zingiber officinale TaxID=94328 RepID=A0A8J5EZC1_ZINOF|nr:hypothetical protein ZIOFF_061532 [Zingiber officinale]